MEMSEGEQNIGKKKLEESFLNGRKKKIVLLQIDAKFKERNREMGDRK